MRKFLAITLLILFGYGFASPLVAMSVGGDAKLPACCRKSGKHHCMVMLDDDGASASSGQPELRPHMDHCPCCGFLETVTVHADWLSFTPVFSNITPRSTRSGPLDQATVLLHAPVANIHGKRGPPLFSRSQS